MGFTFSGWKGCPGGRPCGRGRRDQRAGGRGVAAAVSWLHDQLASGDQVVEDLLDAAAAETGSALEGGLVDDPLSPLVGIAGDRQQDDEVGAVLARGVPDGGEVFNAHGFLSPLREAHPHAAWGLKPQAMKRKAALQGVGTLTPWPPLPPRPPPSPGAGAGGRGGGARGGA